ncbi:hypothetical protein Tco_0903087 [Tanacetum coccineum]
MDDPNITMEEYIRLEEEKARKHGKVFNWETAKYGKIWNDDDIHDLRSVETKFPAIAFNNEVSSKALSCEPTVSSLNNEIDFRISFNDSDDEDYTVFFDKNSFSYKKISTNDLKTDSENDNEKVMTSLPSPEPAISCFDDLDFFKYFENEFLAIVYNDALTSKSDLLTEPILNPQHVDEFDLKNETSLSEYDEEEQNVLYFDDLFPFNVIHLNDLKLYEDNDDNEINIIQSSKGNLNTHRSNMLMETSHDKIEKNFNEESFVLELNVNIVTWIYLFNGMLLCFIMNLYVLFGIPFDPKRYYKDGDYMLMLRRPRYQGLEYSDADVADFEERLERIYSREIHMVQVVDFQGMHELMRDGLFARMVMEHRDDAGVVVFASRAWVRLFDTRGPLVRELILEFLSTLRFGEVLLDLDAPGMDVGSVNIPYLLARYLRRFATGRKSMAYISSGQFVARLAEHFVLLTTEILGGLTVISPKLLIINIGELVRLQICMEVDDTCAWVDPAPVHAPPPPPAPARTMPQRMARLEEDVHEIRGALTEQHEVIDAMAHDFSRFSTWAITRLARMMDKVGVAYVPYSETHVPYQRRRVRQRIGKASTSAAQQDPQQPDP